MQKPLSLYIHWAFCKSKCPYCDFNSHVRASVDEQIWQKALLQELNYYAELLPNRKLESIFFGGGTPSLMSPQTVEKLISAAKNYWQHDDNIEITLEANPTSIEAEKFKGFRAAGVNRISVGVQALNSKDLKFLGREHNAEEALAAVALAKSIFPRFSFDLIYARPEQSLKSWQTELETALSFAGDHISLYQLTIEENTAFEHLYKNGGFVMPCEELAADMYQLTQAICEAHGLPAYEISNHARIGSESRHNLAYWLGKDYIGIGAGSHGRYTENLIRTANINIKSPERWLEKVEKIGSGIESSNIISQEDIIHEAIITGMRLSEGIIYDKWQQNIGIDLRDKISSTAIAGLVAKGVVESEEGYVRASKRGRLLLNRVIEELTEQS